MSWLEPGMRARWIDRDYFPEQYGKEATIIWRNAVELLVKIEWDQPTWLGEHFYGWNFEPGSRQRFEMITNDWDDCLELA